MTAEIRGQLRWTLCRFGDDGRVVEQRDYWTTSDGRIEPYEGCEMRRS